jgi:hypothetical protein
VGQYSESRDPSRAYVCEALLGSCQIGRPSVITECGGESDMSFLIAAPELVEDAAQDLAALRSDFWSGRH